MAAKSVFGGIIALILLVLYAGAVGFAILVAQCLSTVGCIQYTAESFTSGYVLTLNTVGGLVSALVIAVLAISKPGESPTAPFLAEDPSPQEKTVLTWVSGIYIAVWIITGLAAFIFGSLKYADELKPLTDLGLAWLGLAAAAGYAYLNLTPPQGGG